VLSRSEFRDWQREADELKAQIVSRYQRMIAEVQRVCSTAKQER